MANLSLTAVAQAAVQFLGVLDAGEGLSAQQLADALAAANNLLDNWTVEQVRALNVILQTFTLAGGTYTPGAVIQFPDTTTAIALPAGYPRALELGLAIELAPQYSMPVSPELQRDLAEARAAASPLAVRIIQSATQQTAAQHPGSA